MRRRWSTTLAALFAAVGTIWVLQGLDFLPGSFMTGDAFWAAMGGVLIATAAAIWIGRSRTQS